MEGRESNCTGDMIFIFQCVSVGFQFYIIRIVLDLDIKKRSHKKYNDVMLKPSNPAIFYKLYLVIGDNLL